MNLRQLEVFHAIMRTGSVTAAAQALHVSQPAISAVLKHAEQQLKFKLFERLGGRLQATPEAIALMPDVAEIFGRIDTLERLVNDMRDGIVGRLVLATSPTLVNAFLPRAVALFHQRRPGMTLAIQSMSTPDVVERVARREVDFGLVYGPVADAGVEAEPLLNSEIACVVPAGHALAARPFVDASDLADEPVISLGATTRLGQAIEAECLAAGFAPPSITIEASSSMTACLMVGEGAGVALVDRTSALSRSFGELVFKPFRPRIAVCIELIYPRQRPRSLACAQLAQALRQVVGPAPEA
jgi:DNA-binding transcriptional LysR family regulator